MFYFKYIFILVIFQFTLTTQNNETKIQDFIPTKEWQIVKPNQKIPPGLHIRSNLQTGITEAKIMDFDNQTNDSGLILLNDNKNETNSIKNVTYSPEQLKTMLKNFKDEGVTNNTMEKIEINGTKFRSYEQLKQDLETMKMDFKTDLEIIKELMTELTTTIDNDRKIVILQDLEYYLHQIDNAQNFVDMGGLAILHSFIDGDENVLKSEAFRCLASALQGNSKVKVEAMKNGTVSRLLIQLQLSSNIAMTNRILVAISTITRQFPLAQIAFVNGGGMPLIGKIFDQYSALTDMKIPLKVITMISDWLVEREVKDINLSVEQLVDRQNQYKKIDINTVLLKEGWCLRLNKMFSTKSDLTIDYIEKVVHSIIIMNEICHSNDNNEEILSFLKHANNIITQLSNASTDSDDFYFTDMIKLVDHATNLIQSRIPRQEL